MKTLFFILSFFLIIGCSSPGDSSIPGQNDGSGTGQAVTGGLGKSLVGAWVTPCNPDMGKFFQQRIEFQESGTGVSYDHVYSDINCKKLVTNQTAVKEFTFGIISEATANSGQMKMQKGEKYVKEFEVKVEGGQTLLTTGGIILRLTKAQ